MKTSVYNFQHEVVGEVELDPYIFDTVDKEHLIQPVIVWQLSKRMLGTHSTKTISEVSGTTKKPFRQKGTGNARQGSLRSVHMRGGGVSHGPVVRSHAFNIQKKVRKAALRYALSHKLSIDRLKVIDSFNIDNPKTSNLKALFAKYNDQYKSFLCIDDKSVNQNFLLASRNIYNLNLMPQIGTNVYDVVRHDCIIISLDALKSLEVRLK